MIENLKYKCSVLIPKDNLISIQNFLKENDDDSDENLIYNLLIY